ncbi:hypothetical protein Tco_1493516 [Tanacetum coccineum]
MSSIINEPSPTSNRTIKKVLSVGDGIRKCILDDNFERGVCFLKLLRCQKWMEDGTMEAIMRKPSGKNMTTYAEETLLNEESSSKSSLWRKEESLRAHDSDKGDKLRKLLNPLCNMTE